MTSLHDLEERDFDLMMEALMERRRRNRRCACGPDLPGYCPGPDACPYNQEDEDDN